MTSVTLRPFPYPFRAALTICSDIDNTADTVEFLAIQQFLNTTSQTEMGRGVGLEIGNSFYFYDKNLEFSYFTGDARAPHVIIDLIRAGYLDVLHSYGDAANSPQQIARALDELDKHGCRLQVWVNHHGSRNNIGGKFDYMLTPSEGDILDSETYHMDRTAQLGIRYAWVGATTRRVGQDARLGRGVSNMWDKSHKYSSALTLAKEGRKWALGRLGDQRFQLHADNRLTRPLRLRNGYFVHEFLRYGHHPAGVSHAATSAGLAYMISAEKLTQLIDREGYMIVYSHLGKNDGFDDAIAPETQAALRHLADMQTDGKIYVTTTAKLLNYHTTRNYLDYTAHFDEETRTTRIDIHGIDDPLFGAQPLTSKNLQGITFYVPDSDRAEIWINNRRHSHVHRNRSDSTGRESVSIPLQRLSYPF